jgi:nickel/cobalt transporter (NicO) family protein
MAKAGKWSTTRTTWVTIACGIGHVLSSVVLGLIGIALGIVVSNLEFIESTRGEIAGWLLLSFGFVYLIWGIRRAYKNKPHTHIHLHSDGTKHEHVHTHTNEHTHVHETEKKPNLTPWVLFTIFIFGPCEPLIPILMYPAATESTFGLVVVTIVFSLVTIGTMLAVVLAVLRGIEFLPMKKMERYTHAIAGGFVFFSGVAIIFLGL